MKNVIAGILGLTIFALGSASCAEYKYVNYSAPDGFEGGKTIFILDVASKEIGSSDVIDAISFCDDSAEFICAHTDWMDFYLPKRKVLIGERWSHSGVEFEMLRADSLEMLGVSKAVRVVKASRRGLQESQQFFYYSDIDGLLAIKDVRSTDGRILFFVAAGEKGFPK